MSTADSSEPTRDILAEGGHYDEEKPWIARYDFLESRGYILRPRYRPGWVAPWKPTDKFDSMEEAIFPRVSATISSHIAY